VLPVLLISLLVFCVPPAAGEAPLDWYWTVGGVAGVAAFNALVWWVGSRAATRLSRLGTAAAALRAVRAFRLLQVGTVGFVVLDVFALRWPSLVESAFARLPQVPLVAELLLLSPVLVMISTAMACQYAFRRTQVPLELGMAKYLVLRFRTELAIVLVPWLLLVGISDAAALLWARGGGSGLGGLLLPLGLVAALVAFGPLLLRLVWRTSRLPAGPLRERLERFCRGARFRCRDILVWHTYNSLPNAAVIGLLPRARYVLLTDALLTHCTHEEIEGIFAHEVGHIKHHHLAFYLLFALAFVGLYANGVDLLAGLGWVAPLGHVFGAELTRGQGIAMVAFAVPYWIFAFGYLSRRLEQQADVFALRASSDATAFVAALRKLGELSGAASSADSWRHFGIPRRTRFLMSVLADPGRGDRAERAVQLVRLAVTVLLAAATVRLALWPSGLVAM